MEISFHRADPATLPSDALILPLASGDGESAADRIRAAGLDPSLTAALADLADDAGLTGASGQTLVVPTLGGAPAKRIILAGTGAPDDTEAMRQGVAAAVSAALRDGGASLVFAVPASGDRLAAVSAAVEAAVLTSYRFTTYYGTAHARTKATELASLTISAPDLPEADVDPIISRATAIATGTRLARDLVNEPANAINPETMARRAEEVASDHHLDFDEIGVDRLEEMGAGAILAVGRGSATPPRLVHLTYHPDPAVASGRRVGLVGKCITFDTGGYSIKTADGMKTMKTDMSGGAAVLGTMSILRAIDCPHEVHGVICAAENMISGDAFRPGDILTASNGVTIEVLSTDAEGRLVLADGLVFTSRQGVDEMVDLATLTGAAVVALGEHTAALFSSDDTLADNLLGAAASVGEELWRMPLSDSLRGQIRGDVGDIKNSGGRPGGAITAALFLDHFREGLPWAHLDIAGPAFHGGASGYQPAGATGFGVRTLAAWLSA